MADDDEKVKTTAQVTAMLERVRANLAPTQTAVDEAAKLGVKKVKLKMLAYDRLLKEVKRFHGDVVEALNAPLEDA